MRLLRKVAGVVLVSSFLVPSAKGKEAETLPDDVKALCRQYVARFGSERTELVYHHRLDGPQGIDALTSPAEIAAGTVAGKPLPYGYGSGIQDVALENGQFLFALCDVYDVTHDPVIGDLAQRIFRGIRLVATVSPEPGFAPRGPHPDGRSYYRDSSRDQHAALAEALWRYGRCDLATIDDRRFIASELDEMARRMEANDWKIMVEDGSQIAHVGFSWKQSTPIGAISLLSFLAMVTDATGDPHWKKVYQEYSTEKDSYRWNHLLNPDSVEAWKPLTLYSNQFSQAVLALQRAESDPERKQQLAELQRRLARRALQSNVFDPTYWRRLDWAGGEADELAGERLAPLGLSLNEPRNVAELLAAYEPAWMGSENGALRSTGNKLCFGVPTAAFHKALASGNAELVAEVAPHIRRMVQVMLDHGADYDRGENFNRTVMLGLLLWAVEARGGTDSPTLGSLGLGPSMDVDVQDGLLYAIGEGKLHVVDVTDLRSPVVKGTIGGLGRVRQLCVDKGVAYITAREDGLFLVDVSDPEQMRILAHYDTIELATGIAVSGDVASVACRNAGVELIDVSSPEKPVHLSTIRTGEAQSVCIRDGILYTGVWGTAELVICDISDPRTPAVLSRAKLDGYGDGVDVRGDYCFAATGHHARSMPHRTPTDPGYGRGHGLEIFNVSDPSSPEFVGRVKFPPLYRLGMDMWDVIATDRYAFVADTYNGAFVVDIGDPSKPKVVAHRGLPFIASRNDPSPAAGIALGDDGVFVAGAWSDTHSFPWDKSSSLQESREDAPLSVGPPLASTPDPRFRAYRPSGQVHAVDFDDNVAFVACGNAGLHAVDLAKLDRPLRTYPTEGFALSVAANQRRVYVAEGEGGLSIWKHNGLGQLEALGRYCVPNDSVRQVVIAADKYALLHVGASTLHIVDVSEAKEPTRVLKDSRLGLFYYSPITCGLLADRHALCHWHVTGLHHYDLTGDTPRFSGLYGNARIGSRNGAAILGDRALVTCRGGYALISQEEQRPLDQWEVHRIRGLTFHGKPTVVGDRLYLSDRYTGIVTAIDISDPGSPQLVAKLQLDEHPGLIAVHEGTAVIPAGYQGLLVWDACGRD
jgi:hypothetical protein